MVAQNTSQDTLNQIDTSSNTYLMEQCPTIDMQTNATPLLVAIPNKIIHPSASSNPQISNISEEAIMEEFKQLTQIAKESIIKNLNEAPMDYGDPSFH